MARALIVGCGCRGRLLGTRLLEQGWAVRGTSREERGLEPIGAAGIEPALADPGRPATVLELVGDVTVVHWLLGSVQGEREAVLALHGSALECLLERLVETPVRGFVYEAAGSVEPADLRRGEASVRAAAERWRIPAAAPAADPSAHIAWAGEMLRTTLALTADGPRNGDMGRF